MCFYFLFIDGITCISSFSSNFVHIWVLPLSWKNMPSLWANFNHVFELFQDLFSVVLLYWKDALETRLPRNGTCSFNKPYCSSLNGITASANLFIKNFCFDGYRIFFHIWTSQQQRPKKYLCNFNVLLPSALTPWNKSRRHMNQIFRNYFSQFQPSPVRVKSL